MFQVTNDDWLTEVIESNSEAVLVKFTADWCQPCKQFQLILDELATEMLHVKFVTVDINESEALANASGVRSIPTLVVFRNGQETGREIGSRSKVFVQHFIETS